jgi:hypothetical protein
MSLLRTGHLKAPVEATCSSNEDATAAVSNLRLYDTITFSMKSSAAFPEKTLCVLANREVRKIPAGWVHPIDGQGRPIPLSPDDMPKVIGLEHRQLRLCVYETTTEGTPCSPAFPDSSAGRRALLEHCVRHVPLFAAHRGSPTSGRESSSSVGRWR